MNEKKGLMGLINKRIFLPPAIVLVIAVAIGAIFPEQFGNGCNAVLGFITEQLGWLFTIGAIILFAFCLWAGFSKYGKIRLGGPNAKPTLSKFQWFAVSFTSSIAIGVSYWCVAEPVNYLMNPPAFLHIDGGTAEAAKMAMRYSYLHWSLVPFGIYASAGVAIAFMFYNAKRGFKVSSALYPVLGEKTEGVIGNVVDSLAIFAMVGGIATSLGLGTMQIAGGLDHIFGIGSGIVTLSVIVIIMTIFYTIIATTGVHNGIKHVGTINMYLYFALMLFVFVFGPTRAIIENTITATGDFIQNVIPLVTNLDPIEQTGFHESWTSFYWAWWLAFAPLTGLFMVRLAKGRTVREFVLVNLVAPASFIFIWFGTWGSAGIFSELFDGTNLGERIMELGNEYAIFEMLSHYPVPMLTAVLFLILIALSFNTQAEAVAYTLSAMTTVGFDKDGNEKEPPRAVTIFWGVGMGLLTLVLLYTGGEQSFQALQTSVVVCGLPIVLLQLWMAYAYWKGMRRCKELDRVGTFDEIADEGTAANENTQLEQHTAPANGFIPPGEATPAAGK